jgi:hypothetical protein
MPYISHEYRPSYNEAIAELGEVFRGMPKGHLTYVLYMLMGTWVEGQEKQGYNELSDAIGAATDAAAEFRRKELDIYEDEKIIQNGDCSFSFSR